MERDNINSFITGLKDLNIANAFELAYLLNIQILFSNETTTPSNVYRTPIQDYIILKQGLENVESLILSEIARLLFPEITDDEITYLITGLSKNKLKEITT